MHSSVFFRAFSFCHSPAAPRPRPTVAGLALAVCLGAAGAAQAAPSEAPAGAATCVACHGANGEGNTAGSPRLAGQNPEYLTHALTMFKAGTRVNAVMQSIASGVPDADIPVLAAYFAGLHSPGVTADAKPDPALAAAGLRLSQVGSPGHEAIACFSCHGATGYGAGVRFPGLAGQPEAFTVDRLHEFQARARLKAGEPGSMTAVSAQMDETQVRQTAAYSATLPPPR